MYRECVKWRDVIRGTLQIQQKMFLAPVKKVAFWRRMETSEANYRLHRTDVGQTGEFEEALITTGHLNNILLEHARGYSAKWLAEDEYAKPVEFKRRPRTDSSLTKCFLTQPPAETCAPSL